MKSAYLDTNILSLYVANPTVDSDWNTVQQFWEMAERHRVRLETSTVTTEEAKEGHKRQVRRRERVLRSLRVVHEPKKNRLEAADWCKQIKRFDLYNDARHFLMAVRMHAPYLITLDTRDFVALAKAFPGKAPSVIHPKDVFSVLTWAPIPKTNPPFRTRHHRPSRLTKKIMAEIERGRRRRAVEPGGFFDVLRELQQKGRI